MPQRPSWLWIGVIASVVFIIGNNRCQSASAFSSTDLHGAAAVDLHLPHLFILIWPHLYRTNIKTIPEFIMP